ncbi:MAG: UDP-N-acetylglucosamine pyrophosphorylase [Verrucomicrobia bacterium]|nr:UDP-N-acetylglucosamine pyrophosphorylase [Verrucomicrobiota bacterium]
MALSLTIKTLQKRGVTLLAPETVYISDDVDIRKIAPGCVIHPSCRIRGKATSIGPSCIIGEEAPVTLDSCQLGEDVSLKGGFFSNATFLDGATFGSCAHVRPGTLAEEQSCAAHCVGLKQTLLMPYVTIGSLVNLCDCLVAGGTDRRNYTEIGSSYIHFNFTPHRDKATASLIGDVPRGVLLGQPPIFLGGHGGLVGPVRLEYGNVVAAGSVWRRDILAQGHLYAGQPHLAGTELPYTTATYRKIDRIVLNGLIYIGNIMALRDWYLQVRSIFMDETAWEKACHAGALQKLEVVLDERFKRLTELAANVKHSMSVAGGPGKAEKAWVGQQKKFTHNWPAMAERIRTINTASLAVGARDALLDALQKEDKRYGYLESVRKLDRKARAAGARWLQAIVDSVSSLWNSGSKE